MASFDEHIAQAKKNLTFLNDVNNNVPNSWDWQVTVSFYVAVHIMNAHIAQTSDLHYRSHEDVNNSLNPYRLTSPNRLSEDDYKAYVKLQGLARRARYLCHEDKENRSENCHSTYDKHFARAVKNLDIVITMIKQKYGVQFETPKLSCIELKSYKADNFVIAS